MKPRPWLAYALRGAASAGLFVSGYALTANSPFALRMRDDVPDFLPGLDGAQGLALLLSALLALTPLVAGGGYLRAYMVSAFIVTGLGAYWWTTVPWDELVTESDFPAARAPGLVDYLLTAAPAFVGAAYAALANASTLRADLERRGAPADEARRVWGASFLAGGVALLLATALAGALWWALAQGALSGVAGLVGMPALLAAATVLVLAYAAGSRLWRVSRVRRPSPAAGGRAGPGRTRGRRSPS